MLLQPNQSENKIDPKIIITIINYKTNYWHKWGPISRLKTISLSLDHMLHKEN